MNSDQLTMRAAMANPAVVKRRANARLMLMMAAMYRSEGRRAAAARHLIQAQADMRLSRGLDIVEWIPTAKRYDESQNRHAVRYLP